MLRKTILRVAACVTLLWAGTALAISTQQQNCDYARITAWKIYTSCMDTVLAKDAKEAFASWEPRFAAFAKCRHTYFKKWAGLQPKASLAGSTCIGTRFKDNGDQTVTDNLSGLVWEKKDNLDGAINVGNPHDADNRYTWSTGTNKGDGTAFATFLADASTGLNVTGFAGANDWRLPTLAELQTVLLDFTCTGAGGGATCVCTGPCVDPALDGANTQSTYWSATSVVWAPNWAWYVGFTHGAIFEYPETSNSYVRAVRGGL